MSEREITIIAPDGYEAVYDEGGTVTFRVKEPVPGIEALNIEHNSFRGLYNYETWISGSWQKRRAEVNPAAYADNPQYRNFTPVTTVNVVISHPSQNWVDEAQGLLEDYLTEHLASITADEIHVKDRQLPSNGNG